MYATYQCENCESKTEYKKEYGQEWPESFYCRFCEENSMKKIFSISGVSVPAGKYGNAKNGYTSSK